ncbi:hypothetical protein DMI65_24415 [Escherichia coli]|nr:hypothetical protein [Escherichia coli]
MQQQSQSGSSNVNRELILLTTAKKCRPDELPLRLFYRFVAAEVAGDVAQSRRAGQHPLLLPGVTGHQYINLLLYQIRGFARHTTGNLSAK